MTQRSVERIFVAGHRGMVGSALVRALRERGECQLVLRSHDELDLSDAAQVDQFFAQNAIDSVYLAAARVGGIHANHSYPAEFIQQNLMIAANVIHGAWKYRVEQLLYLGSSCIYPRAAPQPMREDYLLGGPLEPTNEPYAIAKIAGIKMCESYNRQFGTDFRCIMPTNLYGPGDNFDLNNSHVLPAMIRKFHEAKESGAAAVVLWGSGSPLREFLHVDDLASACLYLLSSYDEPEPINIGTGVDLSIRELAELVREVVGFEGEIVWDSSKPDGTPRKLLDVSRIKALGWEPRIGLREGIASTYEWYLGQL